MGKVIAVWGTPGSGKTVLSMKLAERLYQTGRRHKVRIVTVLTDVLSPSMPVIFPLYPSDATYSLGSLLAKTTITADDIFSYTTLIKGRDNLGVIGYKENENSRSHPEYTREKAKVFLRTLAENTDYAIIDCMTDPDDSILSETALLEADESIRLMTPDLKCLSYCMSQNKHFASRGYMPPEQITVINTPVQAYAMPISEIRGHIGKVDFTLPYSPELARQSLEGSVSEETNDRRFMNAVGMIAGKVGER